MFEFELKIVIVGVGTKSNFLHQVFGGMGLDFLFFPLLFVLILAVIGDTANGWRRRFSNENQVQPQTLGHLEGLGQGVNPLFYVFTNQSNLFGADILVDGIHRLLGPTVKMRIAYGLVDNDLLV
jgi:hypothetical protein